MALIDANYNIETNRGSMLPLTIKSKTNSFKVNDIVRFTLMEKKNCDNVILQKDVTVETPGESVQIVLSADEMKIGDIINKPVDYWYEVELNPDTPNTQTILGYTKQKGAKILTLLPEGGGNK